MQKQNVKRATKMVCIFVQAMAMCLHHKFPLTQICTHAMWCNQHKRS